MERVNTEAPLVAVVIPTWNRKEDVLQCAASIEKLQYPNIRVFVVDNGSKDGTAEALREHFPSFVILRNEKNLGYAAGNNIGIRRALADGAAYVLLVNNDCEVTPELVDKLLDVAGSDPRIGVVGARNIWMEDPSRLWGAYGVVNYGPFLSRPKGNKKPDGPRWRVVKDVQYVIGNGCLWTRQALENIGLLDESFFAYHEDIDWCVRARAAGYRVVYAGTAALTHKGGSSSDSGQQHSLPIRYFLGRNGVLFLRKHGRWYRKIQFAVLCAAAIVAWLILATGLRYVSRKPSRQAHGVLSMQLARTFIRGLLDGIRNRPIPFAALGMPDSAISHSDAANPAQPPADQEART